MADFREPGPRDWDTIRSLLEELPDAFTEHGRAAFIADGERFNALVAVEAGVTCGAVVWASFAVETEVLWLAVAPRLHRKGIATELMQKIERRSQRQQVLVAKTADPDSLPPNSGLRAGTFTDTLAFFRSLGFDIAARIPDYWSRGNAATLLVKRLWARDGGTRC